MSAIKRAWLYVFRKKSKTFLMFLILFGIATATISGISIKKATNSARDQINESIQAGFNLTPNLLNNTGAGTRGLGNIPASAIEEIKNVKGVSDYSAQSIAEIDLIDLKKIEMDNARVQYNASMEEEYKNVSDLQGMTDSSLDNKFVSGVLTLKKGRHIKKGDKQKILIHEDFAKKNNLKLHDKLYVKHSHMATFEPNNVRKEKLPLEVVGIFTGSNKSMATSQMELSENMLITDIQSTQMINGYDDSTTIYQEGKFFVKDPKDLPNILKKVENLPIDWDQYTITKSDKDYPALSGSLDNMDGLINKMLIGTVIVSAIILSLVLMFWINGRIHETGVLLSVGISKTSIIAQYMLELIIIAIAGFGLSIFSGQAIAQNIGNNLVQQANETSTANLNSGLGGMQLGADPDTMTLSKTLDKIDVSISLSEMGYVWLIGGLIILVSVFVSSVFIIRLKPKEILSKMS